MRPVSLYHRHRFPSEIISHCVWLYFRFTLSFRDVEDGYRELMKSRFALWEEAIGVRTDLDMP